MSGALERAEARFTWLRKRLRFAPGFDPFCSLHAWLQSVRSAAWPQWLLASKTLERAAHASVLPIIVLLMSYGHHVRPACTIMLAACAICRPCSQPYRSPRPQHKPPRLQSYLCYLTDLGPACGPSSHLHGSFRSWWRWPSATSPVPRWPKPWTPR